MLRCMAWIAGFAVAHLVAATIAVRGAEREPEESVAELAVDEEPETWVTPVSARLESLNQPAPALAPAPALMSEGANAGAISFGSGVTRSLLSETRRGAAFGPASDIVLGTEGKFRVATDGGSLLGKSHAATGVNVQTRTPIVNDPRVRGDRISRLLASGSYWLPARQDLDTPLSKIDSRLLQDMIVIKGPYSAMYGPGFHFVDFQLLDAPRSPDGPFVRGLTSMEYMTNGEQLYGRQSVWGGGETYGYRVTYGHRIGNDYRTGNGDELPTSYNSRDLGLALGWNPSDDSRLDVNYLRLDQTDVEFPGLVFDLDYLVTDGIEATYVLENQSCFDEFRVHGWFNQTRFAGDTFRPGKNRQIPSLSRLLSPFDPNGPSSAITDANTQSAGYRTGLSWGDLESSKLTLGTDLIAVRQRLNDIDIDPTGANPTANFPLPQSESLDVGLFWEYLRRPSECLTTRLGGRVDFVRTSAANNPPYFFDFTGTGATDIASLKQAGLEQSFALWSLFGVLEYEWSECLTFTGGAGYAERPPTLTELYATGPFIGSLQPGLSFLEGDPLLSPERRLQVDLGARADLGLTRATLNGWTALARDLITYDHVTAPLFPYVKGEDFQHIAYTNTDRAILAGVEATLDRDLTDWLRGFVRATYLEGRDLTRSESSRLGTLRRQQLGPIVTPRSGATNDEEPLPGIMPLQARVGLFLHDPSDAPDWSLEVEAHLVDQQDRVAASLSEMSTPGYAIWNVRGYWRPFTDLTVTAGVENLGDRYYRTHLDYRSGRGVFQPGVNAYCLTELTY